MRKYKSAIYKHLHGEFKDLFEAGGITAEELKEFEQRCFKSPADTPPARAARQPALSAASPGPQGV
jgi:putative transcriptional regulator